jgi:hypothetical protein
MAFREASWDVKPPSFFPHPNIFAIKAKVGYNASMKKEKQPTTLKENAGKVFIDLGKLMFGSFILGGILRGEVPQFMISFAAHAA